MKLVSVNFDHMKNYENFYNTIAAAEFSISNQKTNEDVLRSNIQLGNACEQLIELTASKAGLSGCSRETLEKLKNKHIITSESMNKFLEVLKCSVDSSTAIKSGQFEKTEATEAKLNVQQHIYNVIYEESYLFRFGDDLAGVNENSQSNYTGESTTADSTPKASDYHFASQPQKRKQSPVAWILSGILFVACVVLAIYLGTVSDDYNRLESKYRKLETSSANTESQLTSEINDYKKQVEKLTKEAKNAELYDDLISELSKASYNGVNTSVQSNIVAIKAGGSVTLNYYASGYVYWQWSNGINCEEVSFQGTNLRMKISGNTPGIYHFKLSGDKNFNTTAYQVVWVY